jgi:hypothetical protein
MRTRTPGFAPAFFCAAARFRVWRVVPEAGSKDLRAGRARRVRNLRIAVNALIS